MCGTVISMSTTTFPGNSYQQYFYYINKPNLMMVLYYLNPLSISKIQFSYIIMLLIRSVLAKNL